MHNERFTNVIRFFELGSRGQSFEQFKIMATSSRLTKELIEVTTDSPIQLRTSRTDHVSATNS